MLRGLCTLPWRTKMTRVSSSARTPPTLTYARSSELEVEADVEGRRRVRERAAGYQVGAGFRVGAHRLQLYAARHLGDGAMVDQAHRLAHHLGREVVEQDGVHAGLEHVGDLL